MAKDKTSVVSMGDALHMLGVICDVVEEGAGEIPEDLIPAFGYAVADFQGAIDRRIWLLRTVDAQRDMLKKLELEVKGRRATLDRIETRIKETTKEYMEANPDMVFTGTVGSFALCNNGGAQSIDYGFETEVIKDVIFDDERPKDFPDGYLLRLDESTCQLDKAKFDADVRSGKLVTPLATLKPRGTHVRVKT